MFWTVFPKKILDCKNLNEDYNIGKIFQVFSFCSKYPEKAPEFGGFFGVFEQNEKT